MCEYIWKSSKYKLLKGRWGIAVWLEAGYKIVSGIEAGNGYIQLTDNIFFHSHSMLSYPESQKLTEEELVYFCNGLRLVSKYLGEWAGDGSCLVIALKSIHFSDCYLQIEGFTASAIQWASETFGFPMPDIKTYFDRKKSNYGGYVFDFSSV